VVAVLTVGSFTATANAQLSTILHPVGYGNGVTKDVNTIPGTRTDRMPLGKTRNMDAGSACMITAPVIAATLPAVRAVKRIGKLTEPTTFAKDNNSDHEHERY